MKIGDWDNLGRARQLLQRQLAELGASELATHVAVNPDNGRLRILVAADVGLLEYGYAPAGADPEGIWTLRGQLHRWATVRGLRLQTDAQIDESTEVMQSVWRVVAEEPKIELSVSSEQPDSEVRALLDLVRACMLNSG